MILEISVRRTLSAVFFSRDVVWGGAGEIAFVGRENAKNIQKTNEIRYCLGGGIQNLAGEISPPKGPEKKHSVKLVWVEDARFTPSFLNRTQHDQQFNKG